MEPRSPAAFHTASVTLRRLELAPCRGPEPRCAALVLLELDLGKRRRREGEHGIARNGLLDHGFNEYIKHYNVATDLFAMGTFASLLFIANPGVSLPVALAITGGVLIYDYSIYPMMSKKITLNKWEINKN